MTPGLHLKLHDQTERGVHKCTLLAATWDATLNRENAILDARFLLLKLNDLLLERVTFSAQFSFNFWEKEGIFLENRRTKRRRVSVNLDRDLYHLYREYTRKAYNHRRLHDATIIHDFLKDKLEDELNTDVNSKTKPIRISEKDAAAFLKNFQKIMTVLEDDRVQLKRVGVNINQLTKRANAGQSSELMKALNEYKATHEQIKKDLNVISDYFKKIWIALINRKI